MYDLDQFIQDYGKTELIRVMEIKAPSSVDVFIRRLYEEIQLIIGNIEAGKKERHTDSEDRLSLEIVNCLNSAGYFSLHDPTQGGHVDFLVIPQMKKQIKWYGEAKIWRGVEYLDGGMNQLLSRYASGREKHLGFLIYFQEDGLVKKMKKWLEHLESKLSAIPQVIDEFSFITEHVHSTGSLLEVRHFSINIDWSPA